MATRKRRTRKARPRRAAVTHRAKRAPLARTRRRRANPARRDRAAATHHRRRRHSTRRRNPSVQAALPLILGAGVAQLAASFIPGGSGWLFQVGKVVLSGWALEKFLGRMVPTVFGRAAEGGVIAGGVLVFNQFLAGPLSGAVRSVLPGKASANSMQGIAFTPYSPLVPSLAPAPSAVPMNGMAAYRR